MQKDIVLKTGVIPVHETNSGQKFVYGSELYKGLCITVPYTEWIYGRFNECKAVEDEDFIIFAKRSDSVNNNPKIEHMIKLEFAKRIIKRENNKEGGSVA